jgi:type I restriction enzyme S subunit
MPGNTDCRTLGDYFTLQRGTTYKGVLLGAPGPVLLGLATIERNGGFRSDSLKTYGGDSPEKLLVREGELYVSLKDVTQSADLLGAVARLPSEYAPGRLTQDTVKLEPKSKDAPLDYLYWLLRTPQYRAYCRSHATGTTNLGLAREDFLAFPVPRQTNAQGRMVALLGSLDDKIELNRRRNQTLEAMARALFQDWFVDFGPVRAKMEGRGPYLSADLWQLFPDHVDDEQKPEGWEIAKLGDVTTELRRGISPSYLESGGVRVLNQKCIRNREVNFAPARRHDHSKRQIDDRAIVAGDILVNSTGVGTLGRTAQLWRVDELTVVDSHVTIVRPNTDIVSTCYLGLNLTGRETEIELLGEGSTGQTELSRTRLGSLPLLLPPSEVMNRFDTIVRPFLDAMTMNTQENAVIAQLRDTLLPKLVSGELRIADAEKVAERAGLRL